MKKVGIITLTRQDSLACSTLKKIVSDLDYQVICGEAIGADSIYLSMEDLALRGHDFLSGFFIKAGFSKSDIILISTPYSANLFVLPKVIGCLRNISPAPIILGGNEASNNYKNIMQYRYSTFANQLIDIAPDFIVRGAAESVLFDLLPLLDKTVMTRTWDRAFINKLLAIPNLAFWLPDRKALVSTLFSSKPLKEKEIFAHVRLGEKTVAVTFQRACIWAKKSRGGCLFCAIASQFGKDFHCAVQSDFFVDDLVHTLKNKPEIEFIDVWDDTFNIDEAWASKICDSLRELTEKIGRQITYSCFLRPKGLTEKLIRKMGEAHIKVAFLGADALTEDLSRRMRRGCTVSEMNQTIQLLRKGKIVPRLSVQLFTPESTVDDGGITATLALSCIHNGESTAHVHLYTFPLFGSDIYALLEARGNLKKIPSPLLKPESNNGFTPYQMAYDYRLYDPDLEDIKQKTYRLLNISTSFFVKTYPGDDVDGNKLKDVLKKVRTWCLEAKKDHPIKTFWYMIILCLEDRGNGLNRNEILHLLTRNDHIDQIPKHLKKVYGNFGYQFSLARSFDEVAGMIVVNRWARKDRRNRYHLTREGFSKLKSFVVEQKKKRFETASYGSVNRTDILAALEGKSASQLESNHETR